MKTIFTPPIWEINAQKCIGIIATLLALFFCGTSAAQAQTSQAYAELNNGVLTFYYGTKPESTATIKIYDVLKSGNYFPWYNDKTNIKQARFDESFASVKLKDTSNMFYNCQNLDSINFENFNTSAVTKMNYMFFNCSKLRALDLSMFSTSRVKNMQSMFSGCYNLKKLDVSKFTTTNVTTMTLMFFQCSKLEKLDVSKFNTENVSNMSSMFSGCTNLEELDVVNFNTAKVYDMASMFEGCRKLRKLEVSNFNTEKVSNMGKMFYNCQTLDTLNVSNFNTEKVTNMASMFDSCKKLQNLDVSNFNTTKLTNVSCMFKGCTELLTLKLAIFDSFYISNMSNMFNGCENLQTIDASKINTQYATYLQSMFQNCKSLKTLDLTSFKTPNLVFSANMFDGCQNLETIYVSDNFVTDNITSSDNMFSGNLKLKGAVKYNSQYSNNKDYANYKTGYFSYYYTIGNEKLPVVGDNQSIGETLKTESLKLEDGKDFKADKDFIAKTATYSRNMSHKWSTLCLPYAFDAKDNATAYFYEIKKLDGDILNLSRIGKTVEAGMPVIACKKDNSDKIEINVTDAQVVATPANSTDKDYNLVGSFVEQTVPGNAYIIGDDCFWLSSELTAADKGGATAVKTKGFRAYILPKGSNAAGSRLMIGFSDNVTAVDALNKAEEGITECYDVMGRRLSAPQKGINIIKIGNKTKKVIIK